MAFSRRDGAVQISPAQPADSLICVVLATEMAKRSLFPYKLAIMLTAAMYFYFFTRAYI